MKAMLRHVVIGALLLVPVGVRVAFREHVEPAPLDLQAAAAGRLLFTHEWQPNDPLSPTGDGLGPVFNARSCVECHSQAGVGGGGDLKHNVTTFFVPGPRNGKPFQGVVHHFATSARHQENLAHVVPHLPAMVRPTLEDIRKLVSEGRGAGADISQRNTPALFGAKLIDDLPDSVLFAQERLQKVAWRVAGGEGAPVGRVLRLPDGRVGKFGWKAQSASLLDFVQAACANELGLGNPGQSQPAPLMDASFRVRGLDLTAKQCSDMTMFIASLPRPIEQVPHDADEQRCIGAGRRVFDAIGCAHCHVPNLGSVQGIYSDLLLHKMGVELIGGGSYNAPPPGLPDSPESSPQPDEWRTPPLWGVADSAPYLHDGRAATLVDAIRLHAGQAAESARLFGELTGEQQRNLILFLKSLRAPRL